MATRQKSWDIQSVLRKCAALICVDPIAKIVCLLLAVILWMYVVGEAEDQYEFREVPVEFTDLAPHLAVSEESQRELSLEVTGSKTAISSLKSEDFRVAVSLAAMPEGEKRVRLSLENVTSPRVDVKVKSISPPSLRIFLEALEERALPVTPTLEGEAPAGFRLRVKSRPETVLVYGPASLFLRLSEIPTEIVDLSGRQSTFTSRVKLKRDFQSIKKMNPEFVEVLVAIEENLVEKTIPNVRVELQNGAAGRVVQIKPESVSVKVRGPQNVLARLDAQQFRVQVEFPPDKQFHLAVPRAVSLPERVEVIGYDPALVRVSIPGQ